ncbi:MAG: hypothetical protein HY814_14200 [Candidatus Riflebacteria bacterium]|nr:hypothetical protein [Candidatus Riflebacteria bacterium]
MMGAGHGGLAMAGHLGLKGFEVRLGTLHIGDYQLMRLPPSNFYWRLYCLEPFTHDGDLTAYNIEGDWTNVFTTEGWRQYQAESVRHPRHIARGPAALHPRVQVWWRVPSTESRTAQFQMTLGQTAWNLYSWNNWGNSENCKAGDSVSVRRKVWVNFGKMSASN